MADFGFQKAGTHSKKDGTEAILDRTPRLTVEWNDKRIIS